MPELPEVETTMRDLKNKVLNRTFIDVWTDFQKMLRLRQGVGLRPTKSSSADEVCGQVKKLNFKEFKKELRGKKIQKIWRRGKNIIFELSHGCSLLIHQKLTGHLLVGYWILDNGYWKPKVKGSLEEKINTYIHLIFFLDNKRMMALSDLRKFAKVELWETEDLLNSKEFKSLGPEPLGKDFTFEKFKEVLKNKKAVRGELHQRRGKIKQVLMKQEIIAGIGNIYSDEILWKAKVHPFKDISGLKEKELKSLFKALKEILKKAVRLRGTSISDYRDVEGKKGFFEKMRKVYQKEGEKCSRCGTKIKRAKVGGRSTHFCPACQKNR